MKTLVILVLLTLICFLRHSTAFPNGLDAVRKPGCCPGYAKTRIPRARVKRVGMTPDHCAEAIIVTTVCKKICIDPKSDWAKKLLSDFKNSTANSANSTTPARVAFKCKK